uniref:Ig-like domain-containing protein n=1 Tax=Haplochromis burtoni TaxID=8153 RepID=A0A3Q2WLM1_HAPBU
MSILFFLFNVPRYQCLFPTVKHSLVYFITESSEVRNIPEFMAVAEVKHTEFGYCDSSKKILETRQDWVQKTLYNDKAQLDSYNELCFAILPYVFRKWISKWQQLASQSEVSCHATGFYPQRAMMFWRKDGVEIHEGVDPGEILPNNDGTFQMSVGLNVSSVTPEEWKRYECVFQFSNAEDSIITNLNKTVNWRKNKIRHDQSKTNRFELFCLLLLWIMFNVTLKCFIGSQEELLLLWELLMEILKK